MESNGQAFSWRERVFSLASRILPHDSMMTTCPPAPLMPGAGPTIIVASLMRSGTHLLLDTLLNNYAELRRSPLFVDFDAYARRQLPLEPLHAVKGVLIKTHYPEMPLAEPYVAALASLAARSIVITPNRNSEEVRTSLTKWGVEFTPTELTEIKASFDEFWSPFSPASIEFSQFLSESGVRAVLTQLDQLTGLSSDSINSPVMPANSRLGIYVDKLLTRLVGRQAPRINTTIGYRLSRKRRL